MIIADLHKLKLREGFATVSSARLHPGEGKTICRIFGFSNSIVSFRIDQKNKSLKTFYSTRSNWPIGTKETDSFVDKNARLKVTLKGNFERNNEHHSVILGNAKESGLDSVYMKDLFKFNEKEGFFVGSRPIT